MDPTRLAIAGAVGGLASIILADVFIPLLQVVTHSRPRSDLGDPPPPARIAATPVQLASGLMHVIAGIGIGLLFWLSWGLPAVVGVTWWQQGLIFGACVWSIFSLPTLVSVALTTPAAIAASTQRPPLAAQLVEWLGTCLLAAIACAWIWHSSP